MRWKYQISIETEYYKSRSQNTNEFRKDYIQSQDMKI